MRFQVIPQKNVVITTTRSEQEIIALLEKAFGNGKNKRVKFQSSTSSFMIEKTLYNNSGSVVYTHGTIHIGIEKNFVRLTMTAVDTYLKIFTYCWYAINGLIFLFMIYMALAHGNFGFYILIPPFFILIGYYFSTGMLKGVMNEVAGNAKRALR